MTLVRIQQLSAAVANQIAAGEVIERPASVVKELLENALDAKASAISIEIGFGGLNQVKISDNGAGIIAEDLPLAIAAHATSKIRQLNDLYAITSMGFRGEALASIASVSKLSLSSKPADQEHAMMLRFDSGVPSLLPCARTQGTTVEVNDLFFNAPVRKKFLKTPRSEYQAIEMVVKRFALSAPNIALALKHDGKQLLALPAATCEKTRLLRLRKLLGKEFIEHAVYLDVEQAGMRLHGWVSGQAYERSQNDKQWVYVNQRMVKDKLINHAIKQAYDNLLHPGRHPACVLYLTIPAELVDINVHPTKHEVRFQQPRLVHDFILTHLSQALTQSKQNEVPSKQKIEHVSQVRETYVQHPLRAIGRTQEPLPNNWFVLNKHFVLMFINEMPYLVDIDRAHQQYLLTKLRQQSFPLTSRPLLVPVHYTVDKANHQLLEQCQPLLEQLGIQVNWVGDAAVIVRTLPILLPQLDIKQFLVAALASLGRRPAVKPWDVGQETEQLQFVQHLKSSFSTQSELLQLLVTCQPFDVYQLNKDDKMELSDYLEQQTLSSGSAYPWCTHLDAEKCRELVHG